MGKSKLLVLLLAGLLSVFYAEVLAGSSILWFSTILGYIILLPLYMFHLLLLFNLAERFDRLTPTSLYLFGVIFGLYETWMTKVDWGGFTDGSPIFGTPLGFAIAEMSTVTFFWHPVMSFIAPLVTIKILSESLGNGDNVSDRWVIVLLRKNKKTLFFYFYIVVFSSFVMALNSGYSLVTCILGISISLFLIFVVYNLILRVDREALSLDNLILSNRALVVITAYLLALYIAFFFGVRTDAIPGPLTIGLTIGFYLFIVFLIYFDRTRECVNDLDVWASEKFDERDLWRFYGFLVLFNIFANLVGGFLFPVVAVLFLLLVFIGFLLLGYNAYRALKGC